MRARGGARHVARTPSRARRAARPRTTPQTQARAPRHAPPRTRPARALRPPRLPARTGTPTVPRGRSPPLPPPPQRQPAAASRARSAQLAPLSPFLSPDATAEAGRAANAWSRARARPRTRRAGTARLSLSGEGASRVPRGGAHAGGAAEKEKTRDIIFTEWFTTVPTTTKSHIDSRVVLAPCHSANRVAARGRPRLLERQPDVDSAAGAARDGAAAFRAAPGGAGAGDRHCWRERP